MLVIGIVALCVLSLIVSFALHEIILDRRRRKMRATVIDLRRRRL